MQAISKQFNSNSPTRNKTWQKFQGIYGCKWH